MAQGFGAINEAPSQRDSDCIFSAFPVLKRWANLHCAYGASFMLAEAIHFTACEYRECGSVETSPSVRRYHAGGAGYVVRDASLQHELDILVLPSGWKFTYRLFEQIGFGDKVSRSLCAAA